MKKMVKNYVGALVVGLFVLSVANAETIVPGDYDNQALIKIAGYSGSETLTNFPVVFTWEDGKSVVTPDAFESADYSDLRFTTSDGSNTIPYEVEQWFVSPATAVTPTNISGCLLWLEADTGVQTNGSGGVTNWLDQSGNGNDAVSMATNTFPPLVQNVLNGKPVIRLSGTDDDYFKFPLLTTIRTVIWVIKEDADATDGPRFLLGTADNGNIYNFHRGDNKYIWSNIHAPLMANGITELNGDVVDGTQTLMPTNMAAISVRTSGNATANSLAYDRDIDGRTWDGDVAELIIFDRILSKSELNNLYLYLNNKYNLGIKLLRGSATVWVQVPELTTNTELYVYWGNSNATNIPAYCTNGTAWSADFEGVWHMTDATLDSSENGHIATATNTIDWTGKTGGGQQFDDGDQIAIPDNPSLRGSDCTMSLWFKGHYSWNGYEAAMLIDRRTSQGIVTTLDANPNGSIFVQGGGGNLNPNNVYSSVSGLNDDSWHYLAVTYPQTAGAIGHIYIDGEEDTALNVAKNWDWPANQIELGKSHDGYWKHFIGVMDEFRYSPVLRSADWIKASYDSQSSPSSFARLELPTYWDIDPIAGLQAGNGTWSTTNALWNSSATGSSPLNNWNQGSVAHFTASNTTSAITVDSVVAQGIVVDGTGYTFSGGTIEVGGSGITVSKDVTISSTLSLPVEQTWSVATNVTMTVNSDAVGSHTLIKSGPGTLKMSRFSSLTGLLDIREGKVISSNFGWWSTPIKPGSIRVARGALLQTTSAWPFGAETRNMITLGGTCHMNLKSHIYGLIFNGGRLSCDEYVRYGSFWGANGGITVNASDRTAIIETDMELYAPINLTVADGTNAVDISFEGRLTQVSGRTGSITKNGPGTAEFKGNNTYTNGTTINAGTLLVNNTTGSGLGTGTVAVATGGILAGTGSFAGNVTVTNGGVIAPGDTTGNLTVSAGDVAFVNGGATNSFAVRLNGKSDYSSLTLANGGVTLSNVTLNVTLGYAPTTLERYFIIVNDGTDPVVGEFANAPGGVIDLGTYDGVPYEGLVSYKGNAAGDSITGGNDVVLYFEAKGLLLIVK